jgi:ribonuclease R
MRKTYKLGDPVRVKVMRVDLDERKIDFEMVDKPGSGKTKSTRQRLAEGNLSDGKPATRAGSGRGRNTAAAKPDGASANGGKKPGGKSRRPRSRTRKS